MEHPHYIRKLDFAATVSGDLSKEMPVWRESKNLNQKLAL
jgi:hypothetical protein